MGQTPATRRHNASRKVQGRLNLEKWLRLKARDWSNAEIARKYGIAESTVSQAITRYLEKHPPPGIEKEREKANLVLDVRQWGWLDQFDKARRKSDTEAMERCDRSLHRVAERRARLNGTDTPVKVDPDLVVSTAASTAAATATAVAETKQAPAVTIVLSSEVGADEET